MSFPGIPSLDAAVMAFIQTHFHNTVTDTVFPIITSLGEAGIGWIVLSLVLLCFKKTRRTGGLVLIAMTVTLLFGELTLKNIICRLRPCNVFTNFPMLIARPTRTFRQCSSRSPAFSFLSTTLPMSSPASSSAPSPPSSPTLPPRRFKNDRQRSARHKFEPFISTDKSSAQVSSLRAFSISVQFFLVNFSNTFRTLCAASS